IDKFKARLVIQGFRRKEGINYFDTYALIARITIIRLLLALAAIHNLVIYQMDVKTSFLNGDLDEEVYMKQPEGFVMPGNEHKVYKLVKSLYGLKQAPKQWHQKFNEVVLSSGFHLKQSDKCVYSNFDNFNEGVIICLYVDDKLIFKTDQNHVDKTKKFLSSRFSMKDMGEVDVILGIKIKQKLKPNTGKPVDQLEYSRAIGCLMYDMTSTRSDIAYAVGRLSYSDASWINHLDDSSSTSGWVFLLGGGAISWDSKKQTCITSSTLEYEFVALAAAGKTNGKAPQGDVGHSGCLDTRKSTSGGIQTEYQLADMFTNSLSQERFEYLVRRLGMRCLTPAELEVLANETD
nr:zinc finger, CCHC-type [Tanacetum cinerariifolium]